MKKTPTNVKKVFKVGRSTVILKGKQQTKTKRTNQNIQWFRKMENLIWEKSQHESMGYNFNYVESKEYK